MDRLSDNARHVLERRYLLRDEGGAVVETPAELFRRVARAVARAEPEAERGRAAERFEARMASLEFLPNSPTLMNAGREHGQLAACFVLPVEDDLAGIFDALKWAALIHQSGGGTGFAFSRLRPRGDVVKTTHGVASGPVSFMRVYDAATEIIKQGGVRRGANMAVLAAWHPDVEEFVDAKRGAGLENFNLSVAAPSALFLAAAAGGSWPLHHPRGGEMVRTVDAQALLERIAGSAWASGEPGLVFIDRVEADNPTPDAGRFEAVNPCGEQPLLAFEACTLGSVNLGRFERGGRIDHEALASCVRDGVRFLDDVLDVNVWPLPQIADISHRNRKIGLGVMGWADLLVRLGVPYDAPEALRVADEVMAFVSREAHAASEALARERGPFPGFATSALAAQGVAPRRNATVTTIACAPRAPTARSRPSAPWGAPAGSRACPSRWAGSSRPRTTWRPTPTSGCRRRSSDTSTTACRRRSTCRATRPSRTSRARTGSLSSSAARASRSTATARARSRCSRAARRGTARSARSATRPSCSPAAAGPARTVAGRVARRRSRPRAPPIPSNWR